MDITPSALWTASWAALLATAALALFCASRQNVPGGASAWVGAHAAVLLAAALAAVLLQWPGLPVAAWAVDALLLAAPLLCLAGLRRFQARAPLPGSWRYDRALGGLALVTVTAAALADPSAAGSPMHWASALGSTLPWLYGARLVSQRRVVQDASMLRLLAWTWVAIALLPICVAGLTGLFSGAAAALPPSLAERAWMAASLAPASAFLLAMAVGQRSERALRDSRRRLRMLANIDALTKVPNRRHFQELALQVLAADPPGSTALVLFDVDHFKAVNDRLGHAAGDRALRLVARSVVEVLRVNDLPCRHGGDEFVLLLRRANAAEAMRVAQRIVSRVQDRAGDLSLPELTLSFGIALLRPGESLDDALLRADQALYEAKRQGRGRAVAALGSLALPQFSDSQKLDLLAA